MKTRKVLRKQIIGLLVLMCIIIPFNAVGASAADEAVTIDMKNYTAAYRAADGTGVLQAAEGYTVVSDDDWAEYTVQIPRAGKYSVTLRELNNGATPQVYSIAVNGTEQLVRVMGTASTEFVTSALGEINFVKSGSYTIRLYKVSGFWSYIDTLSLNRVGEAECSTTIDMRDYTLAYNGADGSNALPSDGVYLIFYGLSWTEYSVSVPQAGRYKVTLTELNDGANGHHYSVAIDDAVQIEDAVIDASSSAQDYDLGYVNIYNAANHTLKLSKVNNCWSYISQITLTYVGEAECSAAIDMRDYTAAYNGNDGSNALTTDGAYLVFYGLSWAEYSVSVPQAGRYKVTLTELNDGANGHHYAVAVDGAVQIEDAVIDASSSAQDYDLGYVTIYDTANHTLKLSKVNNCWSYISQMTLTYAGEAETPTVNLYNSEAADPAKKTDTILPGIMTASVRLPSCDNGKQLAFIFAVYDGSKLYKAQTAVTTVSDTAINLTVEDIQAGTYTYKIFVWKGFDFISPLYSVLH